MEAIWLAVVVSVLAVAALAYLGVFSSVRVREESLGPLALAYVEHRGPHHKVGRHYPRIRDAVRAAGLDDSLGYALVAYGVPGEVPAEELRGRPAVLLDPATADADLERLRSDGGLADASLLRVPRQTFYAGWFPFRNVLSYMLAPIKVYPAISGFVKASGACDDDDGRVPDGAMPGALELYPGDRIGIAVPARASSPFYVLREGGAAGGAAPAMAKKEK